MGALEEDSKDSTSILSDSSHTVPEDRVKVKHILFLGKRNRIINMKELFPPLLQVGRIRDQFQSLKLSMVADHRPINHLFHFNYSWLLLRLGSRFWCPPTDLYWSLLLPVG